ncbi:uncharacterized protein LOC119765139 [Culex quinquefasciatus]|uniref:uncharacterized protein LOC119765139 n=1 Tax=Culex quinquefasciatus TaxID=7176 RepID=UPI0018E394BD|nr:uncharacterized protein LOC119765139 [Culex quinquefasciatus]XP_038104289.1 uncharacterized protein LOC119765139 [Culex quinquefasciatus]
MELTERANLKMTTKMQNPTCSYKTITLDSHGIDYQRQTACVLLQRSMEEHGENSEFVYKLAFEVTEGGKFDDIGLFINGAWILIQTKHAKSEKGGPYLLTDEMLFKEDNGAFSILKYLKEYHKMKWSYGPIKYIVLFTNRVFETAKAYPEAELDGLLKFSTGIHCQLRLEDFERETFKFYYNKIEDAMVKLFENEELDAIIIKFNVFLKEILYNSVENVRLSNEIKNNNPDIQRLWNSLREKIKDKTVSIDKMGDFWSQTKNLIITGIDDKTINDFFSKFVLSTGQPDLTAIQQEIKDKGLLWMRSWMQPEYFGQIDAGFLETFLNKFVAKFKEYEDTLKVTRVNTNGKERVLSERKFFQVNDGQKFLQGSQTEILEATQGYCGRLEPTIAYYVNRTISVLNAEYSKNILDTEFVQKLYSNFSNKQCYVLTDQPGMGKTTLWHFLAFGAQKTHLDKFVFLVNLNKLRNNIPNIEKLEDVLTSRVFDSVLSKSNVEKIVRETTKPTLLFLDAFDELSSNKDNNDESNQDKALKLISVLLRKNNLKIIISGRKHVKEKLERHLNGISLELQEFNRAEQESFLERFWNKNDAGKVSKFSKKLLDKFHKDIGRVNYDFTGIPLKIRMLAEIYEEPLNQYLKSSGDDALERIICEEKLSVAELYDTFLKKAIKSSIEKNLNINNDKFVDSILGPAVDDIYYGYQVFSVKGTITYSITRCDIKPFLTNKRYHVALYSFMRNVAHKQSVVFQIVANEPTFTHLTFGEFCVAKFLFDFICQTTVRFYKKEIIEFLERENCIRNFLLEMANIEIAKDLKNHRHLIKSLKYLGEDIIVWSIERDYINIVKRLYSSDNYKSIRDNKEVALLQFAIECKAKQTELFFIKKKGYNLHIAVECDRLDLVKTSISDINSIDKIGRTPIFLAKSFEVFEFLINANANLETKDVCEDTVLHYAVLNGDVEFVEKIIDLQDSNGFCLSNYIRTKNKNGDTPLHKAASEGKLDVLVCLFKKGLKSNLNSKDGQTPVLKCNPTLLETCKFHESGKLMNVAIPSYFERNKVNPNAINNIKDACRLIGIDVNSKIGWRANSVLHIVAGKNGKVLAEFFLEHEADQDIQNVSGETPLHIALSNRSYETAEFLVTKEINLCLKDKKGNTVLHLAAQLKDSKCLELLIGKYQSLDLSIAEENEDGMTALTNAIEYRIRTNVELLLSAGALPNLNFIRDDRFEAFPELNRYLADVFTLSQKDFCVGSEDSKQILNKFGFNIDWKERLGEEALLFAVERGYEYVVKLLITYNFDVNGLNMKLTPLMLANRIEIYKSLLSAGASQYSEYSDGNTWLHITAKNKSREIVEHVLREDPTLINKTNKLGETALHIAVKNNNKNIVELLLDLNADPNIENKEGKSPIIYAIKSKYKRNVELLMKHSPKIDLLDDNGILKEELNFLYEIEEFVELLLKEKNFKINAADAKGLTPLHHAAKCGNLKVLQLLLREGADVDAEDSNGNTSLYYAARDITKVVSFLIDYSSDINHKNMNGDTPLHFYIQKGIKMNGDTPLDFYFHKTMEVEILTILLAKRACPDLANNDGNTPLQLAIIDPYIGSFSFFNDRHNLLEIAQLLIDHSSELNRQNNNGDTALHLAVSKGELEIVMALIAREAEISLTNKREVNRPSSSISKNASLHWKDKDGNTPLHLAIVKMCRSRCLGGTYISFEIDRLMKIALFLIDHASELNTQNNNGDTALHLAVLANELEIVKALIAKKVNLSLKNRDSKTALQLAAEKIERRKILLILKSETSNSSDQALESRKRKRSSDS